jgi:hypothetical protein
MADTDVRLKRVVIDFLVAEGEPTFFFHVSVSQVTVGVHFRQRVRCFKNGENGRAELRANRGVVELDVAVVSGKIRRVDVATIA